MDDKDFHNMQDKVLSDLEENGAILLLINKDTEVMMITTGSFSNEQAKIAEKIITVIEKHSFVLSFFLFLEIILYRLQSRFIGLFRKR